MDAELPRVGRIEAIAEGISRTQNICFDDSSG